MKKYRLILLFFVSFLPLGNGQVQGIVKDIKGETLPFASIYVQGTSIGTTTNLVGEFDFDLEKGSYQLIFQYVGYKPKMIKIEIDKAIIDLEIILDEESIELSTIEVKAGGEDPAYAIIRKAMEKRKYYRDLIQEFSCEVYVKGNIKVLDAPEKILGQEIGDLEGNLDTTRQGIIYLSESESVLNYRAPDQYKEVMISSKVSGDDQGFSFNSAMSMDINLYESTTFMGRNIISPLANSTFSYYKFKLHGTVFDEAGRLINKIEVIPKRAEDPVIQGFLYIVEDLWNLQSVDISLTGKAAHAPFFDTLFIKQVFVPIKEPDVWRAFSRSFRFNGGFFGFQYQGDFVGIYRNYNLNPEFPDKFFDNEILKVEKDANDKDSLYWEDARPVPLTEEESIDYVQKDSIKEVRESKEFLDSLDQVRNKFKLGNLLSGYTFNRSFERKHLTVSSPLTTYQFNTIQGWNADVDLTYRQEFDADFLKWVEVSGKLNYGFSDEQLRVSGKATYNFNRTNFAKITLSGGRTVVQFNRNNPISPTLNTSWSTFFKRNYLKIYDKNFARIQYRQEIINGILMQTNLEYAHRQNLENQSDYSFFYKDSRDYFPNQPQISNAPDGIFNNSKALTFGLAFRLRFNQKYLNYPNRKFIAGSKLPDLWVRYRKGIAFNANDNQEFQSQVNYDLIVAQVRENYWSFGVLGYAEIFAEGGVFLTRKNLYFQDYRHFNGNQIELANTNNYSSSFLALPYYEYSSQKAFVQAHFQHHLDGFFMDKIPLLRKLQWTTVLGAHFLYTDEKKDYFELTAGLDNIGIKLFRFLRFDVLASFEEGRYNGLGWVVGVKLP